MQAGHMNLSCAGRRPMPIGKAAWTKEYKSALRMCGL
jgi:hypothetical protein